MKPRVVVALLSKEQEFQLLQARDAEAAASRNGFEIEVVYADLNPLEQIHQLFTFIHAPAEERPAAIVVETVVGEGLERVARNAVQSGIGWVLLNRTVPYLEALREKHPGHLIGAVGTDQLEVGRIQGRQLKVLLPAGGNVLYVQGPSDTSVAQERLRGAQETIAGTNIELHVLSGQWTEASGEKAVRGWLRLRSSDTLPPDVVASQNDAMALGARRAMEALAPDRASVPFTGCDGLSEGGQRMVRDGTLAATVVTPSNTGPALDLVAKALRGEPVGYEVTLEPVSYPEESEMKRALAGRASAATAKTP
jgi:ABC-type sugar transport system substrate-binding protein